MVADGLHKNYTHCKPSSLGAMVFCYTLCWNGKGFFLPAAMYYPYLLLLAQTLLNMHPAMVKIFSIGDFTFIHIDGGFF